ncbi:hypothetical protein A6A04_16910 [Paramagnetospirillum marisnigri]|uniref:DUF86 domain-containing protein n=1 Tax=Paramagnetospirillum marisnigri TaxID=1285242 RepID=A0A178MQQ3_9PROT|nr:DUF86 domain-containing protein [Paramagnetospirillum marisnigri]OAN51105.1 hypothetical protein A6A04_16910 [Paramagnetospirillum marisnigri]
MARNDQERITDILAAISDIRSDTDGLIFEAFAANPTRVRSVLFSIGIIGEAAKGLGPDFKAAHPEIPWRAMAGIRDRIVHEYFRLNVRRIWEVVTDDLDSLESVLRAAIR